MARYRIGDMDFPAFPPFDNVAYSFMHVAKIETAATTEPVYCAYALTEPGLYYVNEDNVGGSSALMSMYDKDTDTWHYNDEDWFAVSVISAYPPIWTSYDMYDDTGALHMAGSPPLLIMDEDTLKVGISIGMSLKGKGSGGGFDTTYVVGAPVNFTLSKDSWNGSMYTLYAYLYAAGANGVQIGLPSGTSNPNAQAVIKAALTVNSVYTYAGSTTAQPYARLYIIAVEPPTDDLEIAVFGLTPVADTVVATTSEEDTTEDTTTEGTE